ncbi:unnamed protein product [Caenorhabditis nigoni]
MSSGPLTPQEIAAGSSYPQPVIVPLDFIEEQTQGARDHMEMDNSGLYIMSKAVEQFMRQLMRQSTENGARELEYDGLARFIANSEFAALKDFFPERIEFGKLMAHLYPADPGNQTTSSNSSS